MEPIYDKNTRKQSGLYHWQTNTVLNKDGSVTQHDNGIQPAESIYSDRLYQQNPEKFNKMAQRHFGNESQMFYGGDRSPDLIQAFLQDFHDDPTIRLAQIVRYNNRMNGYDYWRFAITRKNK